MLKLAWATETSHSVRYRLLPRSDTAYFYCNRPARCTICFPTHAPIYRTGSRSARCPKGRSVQDKNHRANKSSGYKISEHATARTSGCG